MGVPAASSSPEFELSTLAKAIRYALRHDSPRTRLFRTKRCSDYEPIEMSLVLSSYTARQ
jgi:hypothetical protein